MFRKIRDKLKSMVDNRDHFDPSQIPDPVAQQTEWIPVKGGGTSFRTHKLVMIHQDRVEFRASLAAKVFCTLFILFGIGVLIGFPTYILFHGMAELDVSGVRVMLIFGVLFGTIGILLLYSWTRPIVFDRRRGVFWKGREDPSNLSRDALPKCFAEIDRIHALQLISERCSGNKSSFYSYEINLVLNDGSRINVIDHGNLKRIREDAATLAEFLGKPLWEVRRVSSPIVPRDPVQ